MTKVLMQPAGTSTSSVVRTLNSNRKGTFGSKKVRRNKRKVSVKNRNRALKQILYMTGR